MVQAEGKGENSAQLWGSLAPEPSQVAVPVGWESLENFAACALSVLPPLGRTLKESDGSCRDMTGR